MAGKYFDGNISLLETKHVPEKDNSGFWRVFENVMTAFKTAKIIIKQVTKKQVLKFDCKNDSLNDYLALTLYKYFQY